jgi:hypothetical protein
MGGYIKKQRIGKGRGTSKTTPSREDRGSLETTKTARASRGVKGRGSPLKKVNMGIRFVEPNPKGRGPKKRVRTAKGRGPAE